MRDELQQRVRHAFEQLDKAAPSHDLPTSPEVWSRLQFRLAYQPRTDRHSPQTSTLWVALYILGFLMWLTWSGWLSVSLLAVLASAGSAALFFLVRVSRSFRT
jgi:hypothetical protein